jgi:hypothetical protein
MTSRSQTAQMGQPSVFPWSCKVSILSAHAGGCEKAPLRALAIGAVALCLVLLSQVRPRAQSALVFYVATNGNDSWSGTLASPGRGDGPFATIKRARDAIRRLGRPERPITVYLRGGVYSLSEPLVFAPQDSGTRAFDPRQLDLPAH